jgi:hypothetical protein
LTKKAKEPDHSGMDTQIWARGSTCEDIWNGGTLLKGRKDHVNSGWWLEVNDAILKIIFSNLGPDSWRYPTVLVDEG